MTPTGAEAPRARAGGLLTDAEQAFHDRSLRAKWLVRDRQPTTLSVKNHLTMCLSDPTKFLDLTLGGRLQNVSDNELTVL